MSQNETSFSYFKGLTETAATQEKPLCLHHGLLSLSFEMCSCLSVEQGSSSKQNLQHIHV